MGKIVISTNATLDGVVQDPDGQEGFALGGWFNQFGGNDLEAWARLATDEAQRAEALLLGRRSGDAWFGARWASRSGGVGGPVEQPAQASRRVLDPRSPRLGSARRSSRATPALKEVSKLKQTVVRERRHSRLRQLSAFRAPPSSSSTIWLTSCGSSSSPWCSAPATRLFAETSRRKPLRLMGARTVGESLLFLSYQPVRDP